MNNATLKLIKEFESLHDGDLSHIGLQPKMDPLGIWTEGYGRAMQDPRDPGKWLKGAANKAYAESIQTIKTEDEAAKALDEDLARYATITANAIGGYWNDLNENQRGAITSFVYNCGLGNPKYNLFRNIKLFLDGKMSGPALSAYWGSSVIKGGGKVLKGLIRRRKAEAELFFTPIP